jgi:putative transposase
MLRIVCVDCRSSVVTERFEVTARGYPRLHGRTRGRQFIERSGGVLNRDRLAREIVAFVVFCRLRYRLTLRDLSEIVALRGIEVSHETAREWEANLLPVVGDALRKRPQGTRGKAGTSWYVDETDLKVRGRWCYVYRAIDRDGKLIDAMLRELRDMKAAKAFCRSARATMGFWSDGVTTDRHCSYHSAIRTVLGRTVRRQTRAYQNNRLEHDHRYIKGKIRCMCSFKSHDAAGRFSREHGELQDLLYPGPRHKEIVPASPRRTRFAKTAQIALDVVRTA